MKSFMTGIGIILILIGIITLGYKGFSYTTEKNVAQLGDLKITTEENKRIYFPPILGGASIFAGIILVVVGRLKIK